MKFVKYIKINEIHIPTRYKCALPFNESLKDRARQLRHTATLTEVLFWISVNKKKFHGMDFDRQKIIGNYIVDFYIESLGLVIEIDGGIHKYQEDYDENRTSYLESLGLKVYRIGDEDVRFSMKSVLVNLTDYIIETFGN